MNKDKPIRDDLIWKDLNPEDAKALESIIKRNFNEEIANVWSPKSVALCAATALVYFGWMLYSENKGYNPITSGLASCGLVSAGIISYVLITSKIHHKKKFREMKEYLWNSPNRNLYIQKDGETL